MATLRDYDYVSWELKGDDSQNPWNISTFNQCQLLCLHSFLSSASGRVRRLWRSEVGSQGQRLNRLNAEMQRNAPGTRCPPLLKTQAKETESKTGCGYSRAIQLGPSSSTDSPAPRGSSAANRCVYILSANFPQPEDVNPEAMAPSGLLLGNPSWYCQ